MQNEEKKLKEYKQGCFLPEGIFQTTIQAEKYQEAHSGLAELKRHKLEYRE